MSFSLDISYWQLVAMLVDYAIKFVMIGIVPSNRRPSAANAWLLLILLLPFIGLPLYLLMGSNFFNRRRHRIQQRVRAEIDNVHTDIPDLPPDANLGADKEAIVRLHRALTGFPAVDANLRHVWSDYELAIRRIAQLIDASENYVDVEIYAVAWDDTTGIVFEAMERAVARGVHVRLLLDHIGSQKYPGYRRMTRKLTRAGIDWYLMLPLQPWRGRFRRPDLRNHRKVVIVDGHIAMMGSLNLIDRSYLMRNHRRAGRQWIDVFIEFEGPIVTSLESMFAVDWYTESGEAIELLPPRRLGVDKPGEHIVQLIPSGPGYETEPNLRMFNTLIHHARERLILCSPYFVPEDSLLEAVTTACYRGVRVDLLVGEKADQFMVNHAQSSYYEQLLRAGVHIWQFPAPYILHTKFALADPGRDTFVGVVGSSNMDMRSFSLNYESSLFVASGSLLDDLYTLARTYMNVSDELTLEEWNRRPWHRRYIDNVMKLTSALQ
ncbi:cardiolipin synthase [Corynebacterium sanguinis]|uniref:cardiolipin synthase n=1 Tax=Corynebacterium sanguinis TaxID=2594913 RepID=UPI0021AE43AE|nr:cardiolipin synthase [Corynebacterium sanguinis]MCT1425005.1 cardiolipin synthase [Corynebacterium sanguinis]MCT1443709.1 cardiolipin synthase [Corynebacterium sanguinis]MCT1596889.1 cardiolipin synthase [Corynebacterium sanguinis]MCT1628013.1 cardiolipin synthase [Corynebacterium sanguinis]